MVTNLVIKSNHSVESEVTALHQPSKPESVEFWAPPYKWLAPVLVTWAYLICCSEDGSFTAVRLNHIYFSWRMIKMKETIKIWFQATQFLTRTRRNWGKIIMVSRQVKS